MSADPPITWIGPDDNEILDSDSNNYVIDRGSYVFGSKVSALTIKVAKFSSLTSGDVFKCKLKSALYPTDSPEVVKETVVTLLTLGLLNICFTNYSISKIHSEYIGLHRGSMKISS